MKDKLIAGLSFLVLVLMILLLMPKKFDVRVLEEDVVKQQPSAEFKKYRIEILFTARMNNGKVELTGEQFMRSMHE